MASTSSMSSSRGFFPAVTAAAVGTPPAAAAAAPSSATVSSSMAASDILQQRSSGRRSKKRKDRYNDSIYAKSLEDTDSEDLMIPSNVERAKKRRVKRIAKKKKENRAALEAKQQAVAAGQPGDASAPSGGVDATVIAKDVWAEEDEDKEDFDDGTLSSSNLAAFEQPLPRDLVGLGGCQASKGEGQVEGDQVGFGGASKG